MKTVSIMWFKGLLAAAAQAGIAQQEILDHAGVNSDVLNDQMGRVSLDDTIKIWRAAEVLSADPLFGMHMGMQLKPTHFQILAFTMLSSENLADALQKIMKYQRLISDGGHFSVETEGPLAKLVYLPAQDNFSHHQIDAVLVAAVSFTRWLLDRNVGLTKLSLSHNASQQAKAYQAFFQCEVAFQQSENALYFDAGLLLEPLPGHDSDLAQVHAQIADSQLQKLNNPSLVSQVSSLLMLPGNMMLSREEVAEELAMSGRSLQRKLQEEGVSFQNIQDQLRHREALVLLADEALTLGKIGEQLGFSESSTFYRAFKRWEGVTPGEYRQQKLG